MTSQIKIQVVQMLDEYGDEICGVFNLGYRLIGCNNLHWLRMQLRELESENIITIEDRGNGRAKIIKRNRNSPGYARKVKR